MTSPIQSSLALTTGFRCGSPQRLVCLGSKLFEGTGDEKHAFGLLKKVKLVDKTRNLEMLGDISRCFAADKENPGDKMKITTLIVDI